MDTYTTVLVRLVRSNVTVLEESVEVDLDERGHYSDSCLHDIAMGYLKADRNATRCHILDENEEVYCMLQGAWLAD